MRSSRVVVLGAGVAGLASAVLLGRAGHRVTLVERDPLDDAEPLDSVHWPRRGIPHFLQPHAFIPRCRLELMDHLPDVHDSLLAAGAGVVDICRMVPEESRRPGDEDLKYVGARRPLIEWALRRAAAAEASVTMRSATRVTGLRLDRGRVSGIELDGAVAAADFVVDAMGRRTPTTGWLAAAGVDAPDPETSDCGVVYYSRYYRQRPGFDLPDGPWWLSPRGDLGYLAYATFPGDNGTFAALLAVPNGSTAWRGLKDPDTFEAAVAAIPALRSWVDPDGVDPITDVLPMAGLRNSLRDARGAAAAGVLPVGDALGHTDPVLAHGMAFALIHAAAVSVALDAHADVGAAGAAYVDAVMPLLRERYVFVTALDEQRHRMWIGEPVDFAHRDGDYALFSMAAAGAVAAVDPDVFRVFLRRIALLDSTAVLDEDVDLQRRIETTFADLAGKPRPAQGPGVDEMRSIVSAHDRS